MEENDPNINNNNSENKDDDKKDCGKCLGITLSRMIHLSSQNKCESKGHYANFDENQDNAIEQSRLNESEEICAKPMPPSPSSNRTSANNSTDNLSYYSDNYFADELFGLQNTGSDDEISINSVDCVYAYRGGADFDVVPDQQQRANEDETDFLEMDFDPDPSSEIDPSVEMQIEGFPDLVCSSSQKQFVASNHEVKGKIGEEKAPNNIPAVLSQDRQGILNENIERKTKDTGAKPKTQLNRSNSQSSRAWKQIIPKARDSDVSSSFDEKRIYTMNSCENICKDSDETCLDCLEKEFVANTIGMPIEFAVCMRCKSKINHIPHRSSASCTTSNNDILRIQKSSFSFDFNDLLSSAEDFFQSDLATHKNYQRHPDINSDLNVDQILSRTEKKSAKLSTINLQEKYLVQALDKLDIIYNADIIKAHFNTTDATSFSNIGELVLYESKKNCDYKQLIKLINNACEEKLDIHFEKDQLTTTAEVVKVESVDILRQWELSTDLIRLKTLNKRFAHMNVLGKVINLIRQSKQKSPNVLAEYILIPQYYPSGFITVIKK